MALNSAQRRLRAQIAANAKHAQGGTNTGPARRAFFETFVNQVDPKRELPEDERQRRAEYAMKAHMQRLALKSSLVRSRNRPEAAAA
ncbi:hypothetical protein AB0383_49790 [Amycolatopsis sp. NPDC051373]|uniref:hypothetical protein n=1 Tax=Amycolatopsis sp. NPDC051373 TaxID=3155801 RepID=UPI00344B73F6